MAEPKHQTRTIRVIVGLLGLALFFGPWVAAVGGARSDPIATENRALAHRPTWRGFATLEDITNYAADHFPLRDAAIRADQRIGKVAVGGNAPVAPGVAGPNAVAPAGAAPGDLTLKGKNGWLFLTEDFTRACDPNWPIAEALKGLRRLSSILTASGRQLVVAVIPDKSTAEPQFLPARYPLQDCSAEEKAARRAAIAKVKVPGFIDALPGLRADEKATGTPAYLKLDSHWTERSGAMFVQAIVNKLQPSLAASTELVETRIAGNKEDLAKLAGDTRGSSYAAYTIVRDGVTPHVVRTQLGPGNAYEVKAIRATTTGAAALFTPKTLWVGDSFSDNAIGYIAQYFADAAEMPDLARAINIGKRPDGRYVYDAAFPMMMRTLKRSKVVVLAMVERYFFGQEEGSLLSKDFLDQLETALR